MLEEGTREFQESVCESFNTNLKQLEQDVKVLREWLTTQPQLPQCATDAMLKSYLLACKNRMERAKEKIENYYNVRGEMPELFDDRDPRSEEILECKNEIRLFVLPKLTPDNCRLSMLKVVTGDPKKFSYQVFGKRVMMIEDIKMNRQPFTNGNYFVFDGTGFTLSHVLKLSPLLARNLLICTQDALPVIIKAIIFINAPTYIEFLLNIVKPFMRTKLFKRIHVHSEGPEVLEKYIPKAMLPMDYGGEEDTSEELNEVWMKRLDDNRDWFLNEGMMKTNKDKLIKTKSSTKKSKDSTIMQGSFKTLCID